MFKFVSTENPVSSEPVKHVDDEIIIKKKKEFDELTVQVLAEVIDVLTFTPSKDNKEEMKLLIEEINQTLGNILMDIKIHLLPGEKNRIVKYVLDEIVGFGPITSLLEDETVTEVMVNSPDEIFVERLGKIEKTEAAFKNNQHILHIIDKIISPLGRRVDESSPMVDARLPDGSRVNIIIPPLAIKGPTITIRKFSADPYGLEDLIGFGSLNMNMAKFL